MRPIPSLLTMAAAASLLLSFAPNAMAKSAKQKKKAKVVAVESEKLIIDPSIRPAAVVKIESVTAPGLKGNLVGTMLVASTLQNSRSKQTPLVLMVPGSGPINRQGNGANISSSSYSLLAGALANEGVSTLIADKRGMFDSASAIDDANAVTIGDYAADVDTWVAHLLKSQPEQNRKCIWVLGHSEGGLVALVAAQGNKNICGVILVAAPGRKLGVILREQLAANPANAPIMPDATRAIDTLSAGRKIDVGSMHPALQSLFNPSVQPFLIDLFSRDPAALATATTVPMLIVGGGRDIQVSSADVDALAAAKPNAKKVIIDDMTHVLKAASAEGRAASIATYNAELPIHPELVKVITKFVTTK